MYNSPISLEEACVDFICENLEALCEVTPLMTLSPPADGSDKPECHKEEKLTLKDDSVLPPGISDRLLEQLSEKGKLKDLTMTLFDSNIATLRNVRMRKAGKLTTKGLRMLKGHKIRSLEAIGLTVSVNDLIGCLGEWTLQNLRSLNVARSTFMAGSKYCVVVGLSKLQNLQSLNVACTEFNSHGLEIVIEDLPHLEVLNISGTQVSDISSLRKCRDRLKSLYMYNLKVSHQESVVRILLELHQLQHLDISDEQDRHPFDLLEPNPSSISDLFKPECLPHLQYLDISGAERVDEDALRDFVLAHPNMTFLGLMYLNACYDQMYVNPDHPHYRQDLVVTGLASEKQVMEGLERYPHRPIFLQKCLLNLFRITNLYRETRSDLIKLVVRGMRLHQGQYGIQMAATACLYNLTKGELANRVHPSILRDVVELSLDAMETFPSHFQLQKNTLLTLCSDRILHDISFDKYRCARLVLDSLCAFNEAAVNRMSVAICSVLAAKISTRDSSLLGAQPKYMRKLLTMVEARMATKTSDITMKFTLSALWNLTDESPATCHMFLEERGLDLFLSMLSVYEQETSIETKVLGLLNNIAEVPELRSNLMCSSFIEALRKLLHSRHIDVSYFSAGIIAHLSSDGPAVWIVDSVKREEMLQDLGQVVLKWKTPSSEMVAYRSFIPFFPLLKCYEASQVQLWAAWAIHHVCSKNAKRYCMMLVQEGGNSILQEMLDLSSDEIVKDICQSILKMVEHESNQSSENQPIEIDPVEIHIIPPSDI
ncbi:protein zyg-11 homolog B-like isoform X1 [Thrips palmi]|uniref:Protein zyg-11 homolog B-like isoform X1 n=1 Tax=Thrips palmi TaxID=161013 RepID=A0A6P9A839_THRPL|nr:protein zyg-11 homolog B-like isoform X1 [Thrips palmi]